MSEFEPLLKEMDEKMSTFLRSPDHFVDLRKFYARPEHITNEKYNEWEKLHAQGKACYYIQNNSNPQTYIQKGTPIYHPKVACLIENDNYTFSGDIADGKINLSSIGYFKQAYVAGYLRGMAYCIEDLELREESFLKNYSPEYLESILYFYNKKEVSLIEGVQKGSVYVKSYVPTKGMPEVLYEYGFHSCVVWCIENLMEKFPNKFSSKSIKKESNKTTLSLTEIAVYCRYRDIWVTKNQNPRDIPELKKILGNRKGNGIPGHISKLPNKKEWYRSRGSQQKDENFRDHLIKVYHRFKTDGWETEADNVLNDIKIFCNKHHLDNLVIDNPL